MDRMQIAEYEAVAQQERAKAYAMRETLKHYGLLTAARHELSGRKRILKSTTALTGAI